MTAGRTRSASARSFSQAPFRFSVLMCEHRRNEPAAAGLLPFDLMCETGTEKAPPEWRHLRQRGDYAGPFESRVAQGLAEGGHQ